jgi:hypothetical protein
MKSNICQGLTFTAWALAILLSACGGGGSSTAPISSSPATVSYPAAALLGSSYENSAKAGEIMGSQSLPNEVRGGNAVAFGDFFHDGNYSMVTHSLVYNPADPSTSKKYGAIHFWKLINGTWTDSTSSILANTVGCLHPRKAIVADFNRTGRPSIFFACHGFDASPFPGESPHLLLSQADGTYKNVTLPFTGFFHSASAADLNGDGYPDVVVTDNFSRPYVLLNNQSGGFTADLTRIPASTAGQPIFTAELIDVYGTTKYALFLGGHEQSGSWPATLFPNDGSGSFVSTKPVILPSLSGYGFPTDVVFKNSTFYIARTIDASSNFYGGAAIQKVTFPTLTSSNLYQHSGSYSSGTQWINWIIPNNGKILSKDSLYGVSVPQ